MNEVLWVTEMVITFGAVLLAYRLFGKIGLFIWIPVATVVANIQVMKMVTLFGFEATLGNVVYASTFLVTDILSENHGKKDAALAVGIGFFSLALSTLLLNLALWFSPSPVDTAHAHLSAIFSVMPRVAAASFLAYAVSQSHDVWAYHFWWRIFPSHKALWLRNNASTMISQILDTLIFVTVAFWGVMETPVLVEVFATTYGLKWAVALLDTPFLYIARRMADGVTEREGGRQTQALA